MTVAVPRVSSGGDKVELLLCMRSLWGDLGDTCSCLLGKPVLLDRITCIATERGGPVQGTSRFLTPRQIALAMPPWARK